MQRVLAFIALALTMLCASTPSVAQGGFGGPGGNPGNAVGVWGVNSSGAPCIIAPSGATGTPTCWLPGQAPGGGGATSNPLQPLIAVPTTSATATATQTYSNGVILQIPTTNTGTICWGPTNAVTATFAAGTKICLSNSVGIVATSVGVNNLSLLGYVISSNGTDLVQYTAN
jgi:hypothetical protein